jgi:hypothetical protein
MWEQYKKRFVRMQAFILAFACGVFVICNRQWLPAAMFFVVMQISAFVGAGWASRLTRKTQSRGW